PVQLLTARFIAGTKALQRRGFVYAEMVDVQPRVLLPAGRREIDEALKRCFLRARIERPILGEADRFTGVVAVVAREVFEACFADERIALEVEEDVALRWLRKSGESTRRFDRQKLQGR